MDTNLLLSSDQLLDLVYLGTDLGGAVIGF